MSTAVVTAQIGVFALLIAVGFLLCRKDILDDHASGSISSVITNVCNPMLIISCCLNDTHKAGHPVILMTFAVTGCIYALLIAAGFIIPFLLRVPRDDRRAYNMMCVYGNTGFIGIPLTQALVGDGGVIYVTIFNLVYTILIYTHGKLVLGEKEGGKTGMKGFLSPGFIMGIIAVLIYWFDIVPPGIITKTVGYMGNATTFLSMAVLGASLTKVDLMNIIKNIRLHLFIILRFILLPVAITVTLKGIADNGMMVAVMAIMCAVPVGNMPLMLSQEKGLPTKTLTEGIAWSTILSAITVTIVTRFI